MIWHTKRERQLIKKYEGTPLIKYGYDGKIKGKPVEVRSARSDKRFRIQKNVHKNLVRKKGFYIFNQGRKSKKVSAKKVSKMLGNGRWFKDRKYPHKFLKVKDVF